MNILRLQIIAQKIFELLELTDMTEEEFFDKCFLHPVNVTAGILHPDTKEIMFGFCVHKDGGLLFYLPEDIEISLDPLNQTPQNLGKLVPKPQKHPNLSPEDSHPDNQE